MDDPNIKEWENQWYGSGGGEGVMLSSVLDESLRKWEGKTLAQIGKEMGKDPRDAVMDLVIADRGESSVIISIMREDDVRARWRIRWSRSEPTRARGPKTVRSRNRNPIRARGDRSRASSASTSGTRS